ncbi:hypothetical protein IC607_01560 [Cellulomonas sp. JH27-2]|uniref:hypothetical protein n=1 Tax=Cellulomonas sp. JH27-2 TaxID=2774139 RepID=UPI001782AD18|nr:hypothetical protein [Cellulomonas sp. JH27-2]MBD8057654.1 hypothetical protein [Cellulomonas sp. JH27-2]
MKASFAASVAFWLRAYPRRWRAVRAEELTAVLADLAGPDATRVDRRTALGLLRGGWATRWRGHPPLHTWLAYRFLEFRVPERYRAWVQDDILGPLYPVRTQQVAAMSLVAWLVVDPWFLVVFLVGLVMVQLVVGTARGREQALRRQLEPGAWDRGVPQVVQMLGPRARPRATAAVGHAAAVGVTLAATGVVAGAVAGTRWWAVAVAAVLGAGFAAGAFVGLRRLQVQQPDRLIEVAPRRWLAAVVVWCLAVVALASFCAVHGWADDYAVIAAPTGCALAPALVLGWWHSYRQAAGEDPWAATDVWHAMTWRSPVVDGPQMYRRVLLTQPAPETAHDLAAAGRSHPAAAVPGSPAWSVDSPPTPIATPHQGAHPWDESSST